MNLVQIRPRETSFAAPFRFREVGGDVLVTNHFGDYVFLTRDEFEQFVRGEVDEESELYARLREANLVAADLDTEKLVERFELRKGFVRNGPHLHILVVSLRCNETCVYCHASRSDMSSTQTDMSPETAEKALDLAFETTSPDLTIEFQGGEPLVNFEVVRHVIEYAKKKAADSGKRVQFALVSNLALVDDDKLAFLLKERVQVCTSLDGPQELHNKQRVLAQGDAYGETVKWVKRINEGYVDMGLDPSLYHVEALLTTTRETLKHPREVVDTYLALGCRALFLRPMDPFGFAQRTGGKVGYLAPEFLAFYREACDYMLELNLKGEQVLERYAAIFLTKILRGVDPNFLDVRSPCGAGIGQVVYNYDGKIFTCDEGRMVHEMGDSIFQIGDVQTASYKGLMGHETVRALALASNVDGSPDCVNCVYSPYCGLCPVYNYLTQGSLHGRMRDNNLCAILKGIQDYWFGKLRENDPDVMAVLERWTLVRDREHFVVDPEQGSSEP